MTSSNRPLTDFLQDQDFVKLEAEARAKKKKAQLQEIEERKKREEEARRIEAMPKLTQRDLDQAEQRGLEKGLQMGKLEAKQKAHQEFETHIKELEAKINAQEEIARKYITLMMESSLDATKVILEYILDDVSQRYPQEMLKKGLERTLERCEKDAELNIHIHPTSQIYLADISKEFLKKRTFNVMEDTSLDIGQCRIEWAGTGVESSVEALHNDMQELLDGFRQGIHPDKVELPEITMEEDAAEEPTGEEQTTEIEAEAVNASDENNNAEAEGTSAESEAAPEAETSTEEQPSQA